MTLSMDNLWISLGINSERHLYKKPGLFLSPSIPAYPQFLSTLPQAIVSDTARRYPAYPQPLQPLIIIVVKKKNINYIVKVPFTSAFNNSPVRSIS
jgi:hypothetical protein